MAHIYKDNQLSRPLDFARIRGVRRRKFLKSMGATTATIAGASSVPARSFFNLGMFPRSSQSSGYAIEYAALFNGSTSHLSRTSTQAPTSGQTFTFSYWVKKTKSYSENGYHYNSTSNYFGILWEGGTDQLGVLFDGSNYWYHSAFAFRDYSGWLHVCIGVDTTQVNASDRVKVQINGSELVMSAATPVPQNKVETIGQNGSTDFIGAITASGPRLYVADYYAEYYLIDGQRHDATAFGEFDSQTGQWVPKSYKGSYGTNGFYLDFSDNSGGNSLGLDKSGNGNHWTVTGGVTQVGENPDRLICSLNPLDKDTASVLSNGNRQANTNSNGAWGSLRGDFKIPKTGKWYFEGVVGPWSTGNAAILSYGLSTQAGPLESGSSPGQWVFYRRIGSGAGSGLYADNALVASPSFDTGDVIQVAVDTDTGNLWIGKNNSYYDSSGGGTGNPSTGANPTMVIASQHLDDLYPFFAIHSSSPGNAQTLANFAQEHWTYSAPTNFKALDTDNLASVSGKLSNHFAARYGRVGTGAGSSSSVTGVSFQPDLVISKSASGGSQSWRWIDSVRGGAVTLFSDSTIQEQVCNMSFNSDGLTYNGHSADANDSGKTYVDYFFKAGGTAITNNDGSLQSEVSINQDFGFGIVKVGSISASGTIGHGCNFEIGCIIAARRDSTNYWPVWHCGIHPTTGNTGTLYLYDYLANDDPTALSYPTVGSQTFTLGTSTLYTGSWMFYIFAKNTPFIKCFSYKGRSSGPFVHVEGSPHLLIQKTDTAHNWNVWDSARSPYNPVKASLALDQPSEQETTYNRLDFLSNGFKGRDGGVHPSSYTGINLGIAIVDPLGAKRIPRAR
jgi:hypothetical protein